MYHPIIDRLKRIAELLPTAIGGGFVPSGTKQISITQNGTTTENVYSYANAEISVNVPTGIVPSGTKQISITQNGTTTEDVTQYASAEITVNVPTGIPIPTGMTNIGSGSFTFASRTTVNTAINHGLNFTPKAVIIWTDTQLTSDADIFYCLLTRYLANNTGTSKTERFLNSKAASSSGVELISYSSDNEDMFITSTTFNIGHGSRFYEAGVTYNWFAFS